ncbi:MAG: hypothetical protein LBK26_02040 [Rickettsiales bacterium]|nr:hypothetical protein [Rickettsiales bacterium]
MRPFKDVAVRPNNVRKLHSPEGHPRETVFSLGNKSLMQKFLVAMIMMFGFGMNDGYSWSKSQCTGDYKRSLVLPSCVGSSGSSYYLGTESATYYCCGTTNSVCQERLEESCGELKYKKACVDGSGIIRYAYKGTSGSGCFYVQGLYELATGFSSTIVSCSIRSCIEWHPLDQGSCINIGNIIGYGYCCGPSQYLSNGSGNFFALTTNELDCAACPECGRAGTTLGGLRINECRMEAGSTCFDSYGSYVTTNTCYYQ